MSNFPASLKYSKDHEWLASDGKIGITWHAQDQLGDIVYVELPEVGKALKAGDEFGVVESVKSVSSLYSPVSGKVVEVNPELANSPQLVNQEPYGKAWMVKVELSDPAEADGLLAAADYEKLVASK